MDTLTLAAILDFHFAYLILSLIYLKPRFVVLKASRCQGNLVPRACDPREGNEGSGIIRFREDSDWLLKWMRSSILATIPGFRQRIIPEPSFPSQGSQARGTRLVPGPFPFAAFSKRPWERGCFCLSICYFSLVCLCKFRKKGLFLRGGRQNVISWGGGGHKADICPPPPPPRLYVKKGPDTGPLIIYATQCLTPVLVQLPILYQKIQPPPPKNDCIQ